MKLISLAQLAREGGVARQTIYEAVAQGRIVAVTVRNRKKVDLHDPAIVEYIRQARERKARRKNPPPPKPKEAKPPKIKEPKPPKPKPPPPTLDECEPYVPKPRRRVDIVETVVTDEAALQVGSQVMSTHLDAKTRKAVADANLQEVKYQKETQIYLERMGALIDIETLRRKMAAFEDALTTHLIYQPEEVADQLWLQAKAADDPPKKIREILTEKNAVIIKVAKRAAAEVAPPANNRQYFIADSDENS